ncbi:MAG: hypothetical protein ACTHMG_10795 [Sphingomonas sp.]
MKALQGFNWTIAKSDLGRLTGLPDDALHILTGMLLLTLAAFVLRRPPWSWKPWFVVLVAETVNEIYDLTQTVFPSDEGNIKGALHDFWLTLIWPTLILLIYPRFVAIDHDSGRLAPVRKVWHSPQFLTGFGIAVGAGLLVGVYYW